MYNVLILCIYMLTCFYALRTCRYRNIINTVFFFRTKVCFVYICRLSVGSIHLFISIFTYSFL